MAKNYNKTLTACYLGFITQAIAANFAPLLFLKFHKDYGIPLGEIALISTLFFMTQLIVDVLCAKFVDRIGYRKSVVASEICSAAGLIGLAFLPDIFPNPMTQLIVDVLCAKFVDRIGYRKSVVASEICSAAGLIGLAFLPDIFPNPFAGILISVVIYAVGSGLIEVLVSPIVEACPFPNKDAVMSFLHSFYCWGSVGVVLLSTLFFAMFGLDRWKLLACIWALIPLYNIYNFAVCPIEHLVEDGKSMGMRKLFKKPLFWVAIILMVCAGASELAMAQWASAYTESAIGLSKTAGDLVGFLWSVQAHQNWQWLNGLRHIQNQPSGCQKRQAILWDRGSLQ